MPTADKQPANQLTDLTDEQYRPDASTPLYDALGRSLLRLEIQTEHETNPTVLVNILTDGEENASREFSGAAIKAIIERLKGRGWTFMYMGANHDVEQVASSMGVASSLRFQQDKAGMKKTVCPGKPEPPSLFLEKTQRNVEQRRRKRLLRRKMSLLWCCLPADPMR